MAVPVRPGDGPDPAESASAPTTSRRRLWLGLVLIAVLIALGVLGLSNGRPAPADSAATAAGALGLSPAPTAPPVGILRTLNVQARAPLAPVSVQTSWRLVASHPTSRIIRVGWNGGFGPPCLAADTALVTEEQSRVVIQLIDHKSDNVACLAIAVPQEADLALSQPLGVRTVMEYLTAGAPAP